jgi:hypothetical protein
MSAETAVAAGKQLIGAAHCRAQVSMVGGRVIDKAHKTVMLSVTGFSARLFMLAAPT